MKSTEIHISHGDQDDSRLRTKKEIDAFNAVLSAVLMADLRPAEPIRNEAESYYLRGANEALCWVLRHKHRIALPGIVSRIGMDLTDAGFVIADPNDVVDQADEKRLQRAAIPPEVQGRIRNTTMATEQAVRENKDQAELEYFRLMRAVKPGACKQCGKFHTADEPHDPTSPLFRLFVLSRTGRYPLWPDAIADVSETAQANLITALKKVEHWPEVKPLTRELLTAIRSCRK